MNDDWSHVVWSDDMLRDECYRFSDACGRVYDAYQLMHQKIDLGRYVVVCRYGGISLDADATCLRPLRELPFPKDKIMVTLLDLNWIERLFWHPLNNATIYAPYPYHPSMVRLVNAIVDRGHRSDLANQAWRINQTTGPLAFQDIVLQLPDVEMAPGPLFEPCVLRDCNPSAQTFVQHRHTGTWLGGILGPLCMAYGKLRPHVRTFGWVIVVTLFLVVLRFCIRVVSQHHPQ